MTLAGVNWAMALRGATGLYMLAFVLTHLVNHAAGIWSFQAQQDAHALLMPFWWKTWAQVLLAASFLVHALLALWALWIRRSLRMPLWQAAQTSLGFTIPSLIADHYVWKWGFEWTANDYMTYPIFLYHYFVQDTWKIWTQSALLVVVWAHAAVGLHYWLRLRAWWRAAQPALIVGAVALPAAALLGFLAAGQDVKALAADPDWARLMEEKTAPYRAVASAHWQAVGAFYAALAGLLPALFAARALRAAYERRHGVVRIDYPGGRVVKITKGMTVLEASRAANIPHASVCGGRGRCSTCRVRVGVGLDGLEPPSEFEARVLRRVAAPPGVRLACQLRPAADCAVTPLLTGAEARMANIRLDPSAGREMEITVLFADLRGFTRMSERRLPYDVVFILNRYFDVMGRAVEGAGGRIDKFIGDGVMALFGLDGGADHGAKAGLAGARAMLAALEGLNQALAGELSEPLRIGVGLHAGPAIVGEMGYGPAVHLTAIGDTVNTASRIESLTKELGAQILVSAAVAAAAGLDTAGLRVERAAIRGREETLELIVVA